MVISTLCNQSLHLLPQTDSDKTNTKDVKQSKENNAIITSSFPNSDDVKDVSIEFTKQFTNKNTLGLELSNIGTKHANVYFLPDFITFKR